MFSKDFKNQIYSQLLEKAKAELNQIQEAVDSTSAYTKEDDMRQEGKYDTRAIEAGYLAGAQRKRLEEVRSEVALLDDMEIRKFWSK